MGKHGAFVSGIQGLFEDPLRDEHPRTRRSRDILQDVPGMASENKLALLNLTASVVELDEIYLEVGCWRGCSLIGAAVDNSGTKFFAVDDFSQFDGSKREFLENIRRYRLEGQIEYAEGDFFKLVPKGLLKGRKVGVYFYDGLHSYRAQYHALALVEPFLADEALVIIDDCSTPGVLRANRDFTRRRKGWALLFEVGSSYSGEPRWWNGLQVFAFQRSLIQRPSRPDRLLPLRVFLYDYVLQAAIRTMPSPLVRRLRPLLRLALRDRLRVGRGLLSAPLPVPKEDAPLQR